MLALEQNPMLEVAAILLAVAAAPVAVFLAAR